VGSWDGGNFFNRSQGWFDDRFVVEFKMSRADIVNNLFKHYMLRLGKSLLDR
jgi:hypothetical protein